MNVLFENSYGERRKIGECSNKEEAFKIIKHFLDEHKYHPYYYRTWEEKLDDCVYIKVDVGSWSEFFYISKGDDCNEEDCN